MISLRKTVVDIQVLVSKMFFEFMITVKWPAAYLAELLTLAADCAAAAAAAAASKSESSLSDNGMWRGMRRTLWWHVEKEAASAAATAAACLRYRRALLPLDRKTWTSLTTILRLSVSSV